MFRGKLSHPAAMLFWRRELLPASRRHSATLQQPRHQLVSLAALQVIRWRTYRKSITYAGIELGRRLREDFHDRFEEVSGDPSLTLTRRNKWRCGSQENEPIPGAHCVTIAFNMPCYPCERWIYQISPSLTSSVHIRACLVREHDHLSRISKAVCLNVAAAFSLVKRRNKQEHPSAPCPIGGCKGEQR